MSSFSDYSVIQTQINGVNYNTMQDYTSGEVQNLFASYISVFADVFQEQGLALNPDTGKYEYAKWDNGQYNFNSGDTIDSIIENNVLNLGAIKNYVDDNNDPQTVREKFAQSINNLIDLAENGIPGDGIARPYMTAEMARTIDELVRSLKAAGVQFGSDNRVDINSFTDADIVRWKNLAQNSDIIREIISAVIASAETADKSLQSLIELIYVKTGNEILSSNLDQLESALGTTKNVLETLNRLQDLHNKVSPETKKRNLEWLEYSASGVNENAIATFFLSGQDPEWVYTTTPFIKQAEDFFTGINPTLPGVGSTGFFSANPNVGGDFNAIYSEIANLVSNLAKEDSQYITSVAPPVFDSAAEANIEPGSLLDRLRTVYGDMTAALDWASANSQIQFNDQSLSKSQRAFYAWVLDGYNANKRIANLEQGKIQRDITAAVTAGQSLNDSQKETVRRYLFVFEEYYKSAAAILNKITQILEKMAQAIAR